VPAVAGASDDLHRQAEARLRDRDQRYTVGRRQIVDALASTDGPVTLPALLEHAPTLAQSSAYRNLGVLEEVGVVRRLVHGADHAHYELAEDLTEHHHHLICEQCGRVQDISLGPRIERSLDTALAEIVRAQGFEPQHHTIDIYGRCATCR
jgi:Fe2+ or Zn2+ uptake regulation protein